MPSPKTNKLLLLAALAGLICLFFGLGLHEHLTLAELKAQQDRIESLYRARPLLVIGGYLAVYIPIVALSLPGAAVLGLAAGVLFGALTGTIIVSCASTFGATMACLIARYLLRNWVQSRFGDRLHRINQGLRREGAFYLFSLRLIPLFPFFVINLAMGLTPMRLWTFAWVSQLGMLPGTFVYVNAGSQLARIDSLGSILSPGLILSFTLLGLFPLLAKKALDVHRRRVNNTSGPMHRTEPSPELSKTLTRIADGCTLCTACQRQCAFLQKYGLPGEIAQRLSRSETTIPSQARLAFECSLCELCSAVCPEKLSLSDMFLAMRREAAEAGMLDEKQYSAILGYERRGSSRAFSWYGLPKDCRTVFFPGCAMPGTRPEATFKLYEHLAGFIPDLGVVLDCCTKPSHDLGKQERFSAMFEEMTSWLIAQGVDRVVVACPNCFKIFKQYNTALQVVTVWELLAEHGLPPAEDAFNHRVALHDPCPLRYEPGIQAAARTIIRQRGLSLSEMRHAGRKTYCCGEGGFVGFVNPELAKTWARRRTEEAGEGHLLSYCAGCTGFLDRVSQASHLADLVFWPQQVMAGQIKPAKAPMTYLHRLQLKKRFRRRIPVAVSRERTFAYERDVQKRPSGPRIPLPVKSRPGVAVSLVLGLCLALVFLISRIIA